jgi:hypothetical protein
MQIVIPQDNLNVIASFEHVAQGLETLGASVHQVTNQPKFIPIAGKISLL